MITSIKNAEHYQWGSSCDGWHLLKSDDLSVIEERMPPGTSETLHCHTKTQQVFYVLSGVASFEVNGESFELHANQSLHVPCKTLHQIFNRQQGDLRFVVISQPKSHGDKVEIINYTEDLKEPIKALNIEWLEKYFKVEPNDVIQLSNPKEEILDKGGYIYYARFNGEILGTVSLMKDEDNAFELAKMAVTDKAQGLGIGNMLMKHSLNEARRVKIGKLFLYSNRSLLPAIHLYEKFGFREVEMEPGHYERANIKMEIIL